MRYTHTADVMFIIFLRRNCGNLPMVVVQFSAIGYNVCTPRPAVRRAARRRGALRRENRRGGSGNQYGAIISIGLVCNIFDIVQHLRMYYNVEQGVCK